mgnify:CR=1 FL=1
MALPVGVQLYSIRDSVEADMHAALAQVKELGYDGVEFAGLYGNKPADIRAWCAELGLNPISSHVPLDDMLADTAGTLAAYKEIGVQFVVVPYVTEERRPGAAKFDETIAEIARIGKIAADMGLTLLYHNHDFEFKKVDGEYGLDILYKKVPAAYLQTELDLLGQCRRRKSGRFRAQIHGSRTGGPSEGLPHERQAPAASLRPHRSGRR